GLVREAKEVGMDDHGVAGEDATIIGTHYLAGGVERAHRPITKNHEGGLIGNNENEGWGPDTARVAYATVSLHALHALEGGADGGATDSGVVLLAPDRIPLIGAAQSVDHKSFEQEAQRRRGA